uniref:Mitochondrial import inner membrane translocase subunit n=1 Tax=Onchocerca volvulus TaxID=6282 RepID=A0A8R1TWI9_ONCVO
MLAGVFSREKSKSGQMDISSRNSGIDSTDPNWNLFLHQLQTENQRQKFTEQVQTLTGRCWDVCFSDYRPPSKLDGKTQNCINNCVNRMIDASNFMVEHLQKMSTTEIS